MKALVRSFVAFPKLPYYDDQLKIQLDLAYITPELIVSSGPVNSYYKLFYRYPIHDFVKFLHFRHGERWCVWDFRGEGAGYSDSDLSGHVRHHPFPDHQAPTIQIIKKSVQEIDEWLKAHEGNIAVLHCKAGKGRSGTIACAYLIYNSHLNNDDTTTVENIIGLFTKKRMRPSAGQGISIISQTRYLNYWYRYLKETNKFRESHDWFDSHDTIGSIKYIKFNNLTTNSWNYLMSLKFKLFSYSPTYDDGAELKNLFNLESHHKREVNQKENCITVYPKTSFLKTSKDLKMTINGLIYYWFNMYFETATTEFDNQLQGSHLIKWDQCDGIKGTKQRGVKVFDNIEIAWVFQLKE
ncbi:phosphatases II [Hyphopichia burtonii NRRL Y-1933]|uniref:phosphatidylinositol-3,4,5-trisphosphate 3-phosphatase n=1 Tax=Hyphopichia burtonii NRRL Y-1933 TaxID=984485 RepID=A0A1E4RL95_9ASCO|nr:phosphatases II [Hyphopichia burtonii NRRL Y-1933]ODV68030.1 phosphatases II [Hyphopichia burtonii NRRL Y-1933]